MPVGMHTPVAFLSMVSNMKYLGAASRLLLLPDLLQHIWVGHDHPQVHVHGRQQPRLELELPKLYCLYHHSIIARRQSAGGLTAGIEVPDGRALAVGGLLG